MLRKHLPENLKNTILIAGATGLVAKSLKYGLKSIGCNVVSVSTQGLDDTISWDDIKNVGLPKNTSAVINTCGKSIFSPELWTNKFVDQLYESRVGTNLILREAILKAETKPKLFLTMSGVGIYKTDPSIIHNEDSTEFNNDFWHKLIKDWEAAIQLPASCPTRQVMVRSGVILSRNGGMLKSMYTQFKFGLGGQIGDGKQYMPLIHIRDLVKLIVFCIEMDRVNGVVNAVSPCFITNEEFTKGLAKVLHRPAIFRTPEFLIKNLMCKERSDIMLGSVKVYPKKLLDNGFEFLYFDTPTLLSSVNEKY